MSFRNNSDMEKAVQDALSDVQSLNTEVAVIDSNGNLQNLEGVGEDVDQDNTDEIELLVVTGAIDQIQEGLDLTTAQNILLNLGGRSRLAVFATSDTATNFHLDVSYDGQTFINDVNPGPDAGSYSSSTQVRFEGFISFKYARLRSDAAGTTGDTVDLVLQAPGSG